jgi:membrane associated rhomboid family serine protease
MLPLPIFDNLRCKTTAYATQILIALNVIAFIGQMMADSQGNHMWFTAMFSLIPGNLTAAFQSADPAWMAQAVMSIFTSMFMHSGIDHIFGNMCFLFAFGRGLESRIGRGRFVAFYLIGGLFAASGQYLAGPTSMTPMVGASGAIASVLAGYLVFFPLARIWGILIIPIGGIPFPAPASMRAFWFLVLWIGSQFADVIPQMIHGGGSGGGVAYWAHIGGFLAGIALGFLFRAQNPHSDVCYVPSEECKKCAEREESESNEHTPQ